MCVLLFFLFFSFLFVFSPFPPFRSPHVPPTHPPFRRHAPRCMCRASVQVRLDGKDHSVFVTKFVDKANPATETVLLVPDVHTSSFTYREVAKKLHAQGMSVVAFDFPGFGLSKSPPQSGYAHSDEAAAAFISKLFKSVSLRSVHMVLQGGSARAGTWSVHLPCSLSLSLSPAAHAVDRVLGDTLVSTLHAEL